MSPFQIRLLWLLALLGALAPFSTDMYLAGLVGLADSFQATPAQASMTLSVFFIGLAVGPLLHGPLSDRFGRRVPLLIGVALFTVSSALILVVPTIEWVIGLRLLQAVGGGAGMVIGCALVADLFDEWGIARFMALLMAVTMVVPLVSPILGGWMIAWWGWRSVFVFVTLFGVVCLWSAWSFLPETLPPEKRRRTPMRGVAMGYWRLMRRRRFAVPLIGGSLMQAGMFCFITGSPFVFMKLHGVDAGHYGLLFGAVAIGFGLSAPINHQLLKIKRPAQALRIGLVANLVAAGLLLAATSTGSLTLLVLALLGCTCTLGLVVPNASAMAMGHTEGDSGSGSALVGFSQFGVAALASLLVGLLQNGTAWPMAGMIAACSMAGAVLFAVDGSLPGRDALVERPSPGGS
jgi:MFS transporter, DHA1 family, multidrug resistance protein